MVEPLAYFDISDCVHPLSNGNPELKGYIVGTLEPCSAQKQLSNFCGKAK